MQVSIKSKLIEEVNKRIKSKNKFLKAAVRYSNDDRKQKIDLSDLMPDELEAVKNVMFEQVNDAHHKRVAGQVSLYQNLSKASSTERVKKLSHLPQALKALIMPSEHHWIFMEESDGSTLPYFVDDITFHPTERTRYGGVIPQRVNMSFAGYKRGRKKTRIATFYEEALKFDLATILHRNELHIETPEAVAEYLALVETSKLWLNQTGAQFTATGIAYSVGQKSWYSSSLKAMERDGRPSKVVIDDSGKDDEDESADKADNDTVDGLFWAASKQRQKAKFQKDEDGYEYEDEDGVTEDSLVTLPIHPYVQVFDLDKHQYVEINVEHLQPYKYDKTLINKLVLSEEKKSLINILVRGSQENIEDIVAGKMAGVIVLATGEPGIGKTLTAEVFSEEIQKPLYVVQCSQLGLDIKTVEGNLNKVLRRAQRWGSILLIDEADVYIHERGNDMEQNAIIGVFLRVLEYYRGVMF